MDIVESKSENFFLVMRDTLSRISSISISHISLYKIYFSHQVKVTLESKVFKEM